MNYKLKNVWNESMIVYLYASSVKPRQGVPDERAITLQPEETVLVKEWEVSPSCRAQARNGMLTIVGVASEAVEVPEVKSLSEEIASLIVEEEEAAVLVEEEADPTVLTSADDLE
jgi:sulfur carrier protein ThiS